MGEQRCWSPVPRSLPGRMLLLALLAMLATQGLSGLLWLSHLRSNQRRGLLTSSHSLAYSVAASVSHFCSLPLGYRPLVLDQLRSMGGMRFLVSPNDRPLEMRTLPGTPNKQAVLEVVQDVLYQRPGREIELQVEFASPDELHPFSGALELDELPHSWTHYTLALGPMGPPVLVTQIRIGGSEWLYVASLMSAPYANPESEGLQPQQVLSTVFTNLLLLLFTGLLVYWQSRPPKHLARATRDLALGSPSAALKERGASKLVEVAHVFNAMYECIDRYLNERGQLFSAISHDPRTPITHLRLWVELLKGERLQEKFGRDLDELELLAKGVLQCVKNTDIHENVEPIDLNLLLQYTAEPHLTDGRMEVVGRAVEPYSGKPLTFKRYIGDLLDNMLRYGEHVCLGLEGGSETMALHVDDDGPDVPEQRLEQISEPRFRLSPQGQGYGLGLGIARSIAHIHGDEVSLQNRRKDNLWVNLCLPRLGLE